MQDNEGAVANAAAATAGDGLVVAPKQIGDGAAESVPSNTTAAATAQPVMTNGANGNHADHLEDSDVELDVVDIEADGVVDGPRSSAVTNGPPTRHVTSGDPDFEVPEGTTTETQVWLSAPPGVRFDRFGFKIMQSSVTRRSSGQCGANGGLGDTDDDSDDVERQLRHVRKWRRMAGVQGEHLQQYMREHPRKFKSRVRKGIPDQMRGLVWFVASGGRNLMQQHPGKYSTLQHPVEVALDSAILKDLSRTFPNHVCYMTRQGPGQRSMYNVLRAYAAYDSQVGYVQGMGFLAAVLLLYMGEEQAFWTMVALMQGRQGIALQGMYRPGLPLLQCSLHQLRHLVRHHLPQLSHHMEHEGADCATYSVHWFNTVFAYALPFPYLVRVWDMFVLDGLKIVFRVALAILKFSEAQLLEMPFEILVSSLSAKNVHALLPPTPGQLVRLSAKFRVSEQLRVAHAEWAATQQRQQQRR